MEPEYQFSLGDLTFTIRKLHGVTQVDFAKRLGVVQSTISKIEKDFFEDVPFNLISKISTEFNIPIQYFQSGLLPIRKVGKIKNVIPEYFLTDGLFKAKTIYLVLKNLESTIGEKIYKDISLPKAFLCLSQVQYNFEFINKLHSLAGNNLLTAIQKSGTIRVKNAFQENVLQYLHSLNGISSLNLYDQVEENKRFKIKFSSEIEDLNSIYAEMLKLELRLLLNSDIEINKEGKSTYQFILETV